MPTTIVTSGSDPNIAPPHFDVYLRDDKWCFYIGGVQYVCLRKHWNDITHGDSYQPAIYADGVLVGEPSAPIYAIDVHTGGSLVLNFVVDYDNPTAATVITVCIKDAVTSGPHTGEFEFIFYDFDIATSTWGSAYGNYIRPASVVEDAGFVSGPSGAQILFYSSATTLGTEVAVVEFAAATDGVTSYGSKNIVVDTDGTAYVIASTEYPGSGGPGFTPPDTTFGHVSNLIIKDDKLVIASDSGGTFSLWTRDLAGGSWTTEAIPSADFDRYPWVLENTCGGIEVYWQDPDHLIIYRAVKPDITVSGGWTTPEAVWTLTGDFGFRDGPNVVLNPVLGGADVFAIVHDGDTGDDSVEYEHVDFDCPDVMRLTHVAVEALIESSGSKSRLTQLALEVLTPTEIPTLGRLTHIAIEPLLDISTSKARLTHAALEFLLGPTVEDSGSVTCSIKINPPDVQPITCSIFIEERTEDDILCETINGV